MILILTKSVNRCFEKNAKFDMTPLLGGTDVVFSSLIHSFSWFVSLLPSSIPQYVSIRKIIFVLQHEYVLFSPNIQYLFIDSSFCNYLFAFFSFNNVSQLLSFSNPATFLHAYTCLPLAYATRQAAGAILHDVADSGVLFAILMCKHKVIKPIPFQTIFFGTSYYYSI